jgi:predicted dehydrogenase
LPILTSLNARSSFDGISLLPGDRVSDKPIRWSILGVGQAGQRRAAAIQADPDAELVSVFRGRYAPTIGVPVAATIEDAIGLADAVYVCTPLEVHAFQVELALGSGRAVVCEYPVALSYDAAHNLFDIADEMGVVLHVGHIELLSGVARTLSAHVHPSEVREAEIFFSSPAAAVPGTELGFRNVARLHRLLSVTGSVQEILSIESSKGELVAEFGLASGYKASVGFRQEPGLPRHTILEIKTTRNRWRQVDRDLFLDGRPTTVLDQGPVFEADHRAAMDRIRHKAEPYVSQARVLEVLKIAQALKDKRTGPL